MRTLGLTVLGMIGGFGLSYVAIFLLAPEAPYQSALKWMVGSAVAFGAFGMVVSARRS
jgi:hypothetical protein